eukprot:5222541-Pyramimonas_sp.AAC.1
MGMKGFHIASRHARPAGSRVAGRRTSFLGGGMADVRRFVPGSPLQSRIGHLTQRRERRPADT